MRQGQQHRRGRGRQNNNQNNGHRKGGQNPLTRSFESNGPEVKVRGTPAHIAEKYMQLARDAQSSGDHVLAENYLQHAEHYNRIILAYREQQMQQSGEFVNGGGHRPFGQRHDMAEGDDAGGEDMQGHDEGGGEQPMIRQSGEAGRSDMQPGFDDGRPQRHGDHQPRFRDRHQRHERPERHERHDRQHDRHERGEHRHEGFERSERGERHFDRQRDRSHYQGQARDTEQPGGEAREARHVPREPREAHEGEAAGIEQRQPSVAQEGAGAPEQRPERGDMPPRRRERFGLGADQPDFLRRPVRRPRREPEAGFVAEPSAPPVDDTPRE